EDLGGFGRPTNVFGFRLVSPATREEPSGFNIRVESYTREPRSLYLENVGTFKTPVQSSQLELLEKNILTTSDYLADKIIPFLSMYDRRDSAT
ncbi:MAG: hypothetical protein AAF517_00120, partial [Planctomycetota bacterium]